MKTLCEKFSVSERRACQGIGFARSSLRYLPKWRNGEEKIRRRLRELARQRPRFGYRRMTRLLRREGWRISYKRVHRLWRAEGLKVPQNRRKRRANGHRRHACHKLRAEHLNHVWAWDFIFDHTINGGTIKCLTIVDEYTRECITLDISRSITAEDVIDRLAELFVMYGVPKCIRSDNGPEFVANAIQGWLSSMNVATLYIEPGSPWQNGYAESFHSRLRDELLNLEQFENVRHARACIAAWRDDYNDDRPHGALDGLTPTEFARRCADSAPFAARTPLHQHSESLPVTQPVLS